MSRSRATTRFEAKSIEAILSAVKVLLQEKHLYQSTRVDFKPAVAAAIALDPPSSKQFASWGEVAGNMHWLLVGPGPSQSSFGDTAITVQILDFHAVCSNCKTNEPFNVTGVTDLFLGTGVIAGRQVHAITAVCQRCKKVPEVFMIMRQGEKLTLTGRSPMETVEVPSVINVESGKHISSAIVAYQSGQLLSAKFLLRTFIEQWCKEHGATQPLADRCLDWYQQQLPMEFSDRFPSLRDIYGRLSDAIHAALESEEVYRQALGEIVEHFDARRVYKLPKKALPPATAKGS